MKPLERGEMTGLVQIPANWDVSEVSAPLQCGRGQHTPS